MTNTKKGQKTVPIIVEGATQALKPKMIDRIITIIVKIPENIAIYFNALITYHIEHENHT
ncbi:hypothetical protein AGMMS50229_18960 [Campylobacterota bacterium]|nr:hypothetical protein AGMMS50229_18960 [Campylobacterota bacterium]